MLTSPKAHIIVAGFFLTASALTTAGGTQPSSETSYKAAGQQTGQENSYAITDDNGENVNLTENADGTYTATYDDGRTVTFRSDDNGNLTPTSGTASLLAGIAAGYLLSRGAAQATTTERGTAMWPRILIHTHLPMTYAIKAQASGTFPPRARSAHRKPTHPQQQEELAASAGQEQGVLHHE